MSLGQGLCVRLELVGFCCRLGLFLLRLRVCLGLELLFSLGCFCIILGLLLGAGLRGIELGDLRGLAGFIFFSLAEVVRRSMKWVPKSPDFRAVK